MSVLALSCMNQIEVKLRMWKIRLRFKVLGQKLNSLQFYISVSDYYLFFKLGTITSLFLVQPLKIFALGYLSN